MRRVLQGLATCVVVSIFAYLLVACAGGAAKTDSVTPTAPAPEHQDVTSPVGFLETYSKSVCIEEVLAQPRPEDVAVELWDELTRELVAVLQAEEGKVAATPPMSGGPTDLCVTALGDNRYRLDWIYGNWGDLDMNGEVNAADLVPLGRFFGETGPFEPWSELAAYDSNSDGEIGIADITAIGQCYKRNVAGHRLLVSTTGYPDQLFGDTFPMVFERKPGKRLQCSVEITSDIRYQYYRLLPEDRHEQCGAGSQVVGTGDPAPDGWPMFKHDPQRTGQSQYTGSQTGNLKWKFRTTGPGFKVYPIGSLPDGTVYVRSDYMVYALNPDGSTKWSRTTRKDAAPVVDSDGTVYYRDTDKTLYAIAADGSVKWMNDSLTDDYYYFIFAPDGSAAVYGSHEGEIVVFNADGSVQANYRSNSHFMPPPVLLDDGLSIGISEYGVEAVNKSDYTLWSYNEYSSGFARLVLEDEILYLLDYGRVTALALDGTVRWQQSFGHSSTQRMHLHQSAGWLYVAVSVDAAEGAYTEVWKVSLTGEIAWQQRLEEYSMDSVIDSDGNLLVGLRDGMLVTIIPDGGTQTEEVSQWSIWSMLAGDDGKVYVGTSDGWFTAYQSDMTEEWRFGAGGGIMSSPAVSGDGNISFGSRDRRVYSLDAAGRVRWFKQNSEWIDSSPVIADNGTVYIGVGDSAFDTVYGPWMIFDNQYISSVGRKNGIFAPLLGADGQIYCAFNFRTYYSDSPSTLQLCSYEQNCDSWFSGNERWTFKLFEYPSFYKYNMAPAAAPDGTLIICASDSNIYAVNQDGSHKWSLTANGPFNCTPAVGPDGAVYACTTDGEITAVDATGNLLWTYSTQLSCYASVSLSYDGQIICPLYDKDARTGEVAVLSTDGELLWNYQTDSRVMVTPAIGADGTCYFGCGDGQVIALTDSGDLLWGYQAGAGIASSSAIGPDGTVYMGCWDGSIYAFGD